mmetsp:Transcript_37010/g.35733  ORF Transcript_37010/g.35733 Transcript_37010/m.35733 type:complete len:101 (-) Transcript_37010:692-994(-)
MEEQNEKLKDALLSNKGEFQELLQDLEGMREQIKEKDKQVLALNEELSSKPSMPQLYGMQMKIQHLEKDCSRFQKENADLHNEIMLSRNKDSHMKSIGST